MKKNLDQSIKRDINLALRKLKDYPHSNETAYYYANVRLYLTWALDNLKKIEV